MDLGSLPLEVAAKIDKACDLFQEAWRTGRRPRIEDALEETTDPGRAAALRELIAIELENRKARGESPSLDDFLARFPDDTELVRGAFDSGGSRSSAVGSDTGTSLRLSPATTAPSPDDESRTQSATPTGTVVRRDPPLPDRIGEFRPARFLGEGGFGRVYYAWDEGLGRGVALKVARPGALGDRQREESLLAEAKLAAGLEHPGIVAVYKVGRLDGGEPFVALEYVEGSSLAEVLRGGRMPTDRLAELLARVADAAHHAHERGVFHRDLTPSNILIDGRGEPHLTDFGLALTEDLQRLRSGEIAGKPSYMAPEQVRGETHRFDGRTDVWALGVILYRGLTGRMPFTGRSRGEIFDEVLHRDPRPPRQIDRAVPRELERICLACLAKRMNDRYGSAIELAEDLRAWRDAANASAVAPPEPAGGPASPGSAPIVPKGLRAFDGDDAPFFLALLPGPRGRDGLPESIRFWKARIEDRDEDAAFRVGLLYGPSGGGKSSLVKAGLLPALGGSVWPIYLEASQARTEAQLLAALLRKFPGLPPGCGLPEAAALLREGGLTPPGVKVLIVVDQFEQWLQAHPNEPEAELVRALRQCDGARLQALLLVRDDFWMAVTRFFKAVEIPLVEGGNSAAVELFDASHARGVLVEFGRSCGRVPPAPADPGPEAAAFLDRAIAEMMRSDGRVTPVRLSLFTEVVRHRPWTPATLSDLGGVAGIGVTFLHEAFDSGAAPPSYRLHRGAAQSVLKALLPEGSSDIRGNLRSGRSLREASGYDGRDSDFAELMHILDNELRMVTPVDPEGLAAEAPGAGPPADPLGCYYQLTHDYLVPPLREWLTRKQRETRRGRAKLRLAIITAHWRDRPEPRRLPSPLEWLGILWHTRPGDRTADEGRMMRAASRHYLARAGMALVLAGATTAAVRYVRGRDRVSALLQRALKADFGHLPGLISEVAQHRGEVLATLRGLEKDASLPVRDREAVEVLLYHAEPTQPRAAALRARLPGAGPDEVALIRDALAAHPEPDGFGALRLALLDEKAEPAARLRLACILAKLDPGGAEGRGAAAGALTQALLAEDRRSIPRWLDLLGPDASLLVPSLGQVCRDPGRDPTARATAAEVLAEALVRRDDARGLAQAVVEALPDASQILLRELERLGPRAAATDYLRGVLGERAADDADSPGKDALAVRQAGAAVALASLGAPEGLWPLLRHRPDPRLRTQLIFQMPALGLDPRVLADRLARPDLDPCERQALLLSWAEAPPSRVSSAIRAEVVESAAKSFLDDPDPGVHSAADLLLRRWGRADRLAAPADPARNRDGRAGAGGRRWEAGPNGHTLVILPAPLEFLMGSPPSEPGRFTYEERHHRRLARSLAVATTEVTVEQYRAFRPDYSPDPRYALEPGCAAGGISWFDAIAYCNWVSEKAGIERDQWCSPEPARPGLVLSSSVVDRTGFRPPTEAEWEYFCRAGTETCRSFGESRTHLNAFAWTWLNSEERATPPGRLLPNEFGLFDTLGSLWEWCLDGPEAGGKALYPRYPKGTMQEPAADSPREAAVNEKDWRIVRGGSFAAAPSKARSAHRDIYYAGDRRYFSGFRIVRTLPRPPE